jgi:hypothetical protein
MSPERKEAAPGSRAQFIASLAAHVGEEVIYQGWSGDSFPEPVTRTITFAEEKLVVIVTVLRDDGPARLELNELGRAVFERGEPLPTSLPPVPMPLRDVEAIAMRIAPAHDAEPMSVKAMARKAGYSSKSSHFREAVRGLVDRGLLVRIRGGVRRASAATNA